MALENHGRDFPSEHLGYFRIAVSAVQTSENAYFVPRPTWPDKGPPMRGFRPRAGIISGLLHTYYLPSWKLPV